LGRVVTRIGMIGLSEGNGHPFSFSAIINGYDRDAFERAGWPVILSYLDRQPPTAFGFADTRVTCAWTQDMDVTARLCAACKIEQQVDRPEAMLGKVDALVVARDDWEQHAELAMPFLSRGVPVFVDKPLSFDTAELAGFRPYLENGTLMSTSGLRYARELDELREAAQSLGKPRLISATVLNGLEKYGIHMLDAVDGLGLPKPVTVTRLNAQFEAFSLTLADGTILALNCLGNVGRTFHMSAFCDKGHAHVDFHDNFSAFSRTLAHFVKMLATRTPPIPPLRVIETMELIRTAKNLAPGQTMKLADA
jgi:predicted dehydrogenase